ncbi:MAG: hypothetical protein STHCBS139747_002041 [Sporothrix thermara]
MVHRLIFWTGFGLATRALQLSIEMRPLFTKSSLWAYPVFGATGAGFGYWLQGVDDRQSAVLAARKQAILEKRARRAAEQESIAA